MLLKIRKHMRSPLSWLGVCLLLFFMTLIVAGLYCVITERYFCAAGFWIFPVLLIVSAFIEELNSASMASWKVLIALSGVCGVAYLIYIVSIFTNL